MALKVKEITATAKATLNLGDYSNVVYEVTLTAETDGLVADTQILQELVHAALTNQVAGATVKRLMAGIPALVGKNATERMGIMRKQPCVMVLATLSPEAAKSAVDTVLEMSLAPEKVDNVLAKQSARKTPFQTTPKKSREQWTNADNHPMNDFGDGHPDDYGDN